MSRILSALLLTVVIALTANLSFAEETSFRGVKVPVAKGKQTKEIKSTLAFSDQHQAIELYPVKGNSVSIPYGEIDKCSYEFTKKHRINEGTVITAPIGIGVALMLTRSKSHWLEIDYREKGVPKAFVVRMDKKNYIRILDAVRNHTGKEAEVLGNADKR